MTISESGRATLPEPASERRSETGSESKSGSETAEGGIELGLATRDPIEPDAPSYSHRQIMTIFAGLMAGMFVAAIDQTVVSTAMPRIVSQLHGIDRYTWVTTAYLVTETAVMPLVGRLSDLWGSKRLFKASIVIFI